MIEEVEKRREIIQKALEDAGVVYVDETWNKAIDDLVRYSYEKDVPEEKLYEEVKKDAKERREIIRQAFKDGMGEAYERIIDAWLKYSYEKKLSGENLYEEVKSAIELMKNYYDPHCYYDYTPEGYEIAKKAEEKGLRKVIKKIKEEEKTSGTSRDHHKVFLEWLVKLSEGGWNEDLIVIFHTDKEGEKYVPIFSYNLGFSNVRLSKEVKGIIAEISSEENVDEEELTEEVKKTFLKKASSWVKDVEEDRKRIIETALKIREKGKYPFHVWKRLFVPPKEDTFIGYFYNKKVKIAVGSDWAGVVYADKEDWERVRERIKEEIREIARRLPKKNNLELER